MTHDIVIIINKLAAMKGDATSGYLYSLHGAVVKAKDILDNQDPPNATEIHDQVHIIGDWVDEHYVCVPGMTADLDALL